MEYDFYGDIYIFIMIIFIVLWYFYSDIVTVILNDNTSIP